MYGKIFESILDSSLAVEGDFITIYVFSMMIVLADEFGFVNIGVDALYDKLKFPNNFAVKQEFLRSIEILENPDMQSNLLAEDGKRIIPLSEIGEIPDNRGWLIVNYLHYRDKANQENKKVMRREYMKEYMSKRRKTEKKVNKNNAVNTCKHSLTPVSSKAPYTDTDTDTDTDTNTKIKIKNKIKINPSGKKNKTLLPEWINDKAWSEFVQHRKDIKKPLTDLATKKNLAVLEKFKDQQKEIIDTTIANGWTGLFSLKNGDNNHAKPYPRKLTAVERVRAAGGLDQPGEIIDITPHDYFVGKDD